METTGREKNIRIALVGAHGTGKTTLSKALSARLAEYGVSTYSLPEIPRLICDEANDPTFFRRGKNSPLKQCLILLGQTSKEVESLLSGAGVVIGDRSLLDHWAYTVHQFREEFEAGFLHTLFDAMVTRHCALYDLIFYVPIEFDILDDGTREDDREFQRQIDDIIRDLLVRSQLNYSTVRGSVDQRVDQCISLMQSKLGRPWRDRRTSCG